VLVLIKKCTIFRRRRRRQTPRLGGSPASGGLAAFFNNFKFFFSGKLFMKHQTPTSKISLPQSSIILSLSLKKLCSQLN
jgi:hypothetical protein